MASIFSVDTDNSIVVILSTNMLLKTPEDFKNQVSEDNVVLAQIEVPLASIRKSFEIAYVKNAKTILNPAPYDEVFLVLSISLISLHRM